MNTPPAGIRLRGGAPIPPPPSLGRHLSVTEGGVRLGAAVETHPGRWTPVCAHPDCMTALFHCATAGDAKDDLRDHWNHMHEEDAA